MENDDAVLDPAHAENEPATVVAGRPVPTAAADDATEFKVSDDENIVQRGDKKYVREEALQEERRTRQQLSKTLAQMEALAPEFQEFLQDKTGRNRATVERNAVAADDDYSQDELTGMAIARGYYDAQNKPDLDRARMELNVMSAIADRRAARHIQPVAAANTKDRAQQHYAQAKSRQFVDGEPMADGKYIDAVFGALDEEQRADPLIANISTVIAAGLQSLDERRTGKARGRREPAFREGGAGRVDSGTSEALDALDRAAARARGKSPEAWAKLSKTVAGGRNAGIGTVLEEVD